MPFDPTTAVLDRPKFDPSTAMLFEEPKIETTTFNPNTATLLKPKTPFNPNTAVLESKVSDVPLDTPALKSHQDFWSEIKNIPNYIKLYSQSPQELKGATGRTGVKALEVITWPFMRFLTGTATITTGIQQAIAEPEKVKERLVAGAKAFVPFTKLDPDKVNDWGEFWGNYYKAVTNEEAPEWYKQTSGMATEMGLLQMGSDSLMALVKQGERLPIVQRTIQTINEKRLPKWQVAKQRAKIRTIDRNEEIKQLGESLAGQEVKEMAQELSVKLGKPVSEEAVKLRLGQIIKGGITEQQGMAKVAEPITADILKTGTDLRTAGLLPEETFTTKLSRARINELLTEKKNIQIRLDKLQTEVPYRDTLIKQVSKLKISGQEKLTDDLWTLATNISMNDPEYPTQLAQILKIKTPQWKTLAGKVNRLYRTSAKEREKIIDELWALGRENLGEEITGLKPLITKISSMQRQFPGKTKQIQQLQTRIDDITSRVQQSYKTGGTGYLGRFYKQKEEELAAKKFPFSGSQYKVRQQYAKTREAIPFEVRQKMGEIQEPAYPYVKRSLQANSDLQVNNLFNYASRNKDWVSDVWKEGLVKKPLPEAKSYGSLAGKYVHPQIYSDVTEMNRIKNDYEKIYDSIEGIWKMGKTVWNPSTHAHNLFGNSVLLDLSGMSHDQQMKYLVKTLVDVKNNAPEWQKVSRIFGGSSMVKGEILDDMLKSVSLDTNASGMSKVLNTFNNFIKTTSAKPSELYQFEEQISKYMKYLQMRDKGNSTMSSIREAQKWLFDYSDLSSFEKNVMRRFMPFYTFPRKAIPRVAEAMIKNPTAVYKYPLIINGIEQYALSKLEITDKDYAQIKKNLPDYMQNGDYMLLPYRDTNGDLRFLSLTYLFPIADITQGLANEPLKTTVANPFFNALADITRNKSGFTGNPIVLDSDTTKEKNAKKTLYLWYMASPPDAPRGQNWDKIYDAFVGTKTKYETPTGEYKRKRLVPETIAQTIFGITTAPIDEGLQEKFHRIGLGIEAKDSAIELVKKMRKAESELKIGNIKKEEYDILMKQYNQQWEEIKKRVRE